MRTEGVKVCFGRSLAKKGMVREDGDSTHDVYQKMMDWKVGIIKARVEDSPVALVMTSGSLIGDTRTCASRIVCSSAHATWPSSVTPLFVTA